MQFVILQTSSKINAEIPRKSVKSWVQYSIIWIAQKDCTVIWVILCDVVEINALLIVHYHMYKCKGGLQYICPGDKSTQVKTTTCINKNKCLKLWNDRFAFSDLHHISVLKR